MKAMPRKTGSWILVVLLTGLMLLAGSNTPLMAQRSLPWIDNLVIIPANPSPSDLVKVIAYTTFPNSNCPLISFALATNPPDTTITLVVNHDMGLLTVICNSIDTINLGVFPIGNYLLTYQLTTGSPPTPNDQKNIAFTVNLTTGLNTEMPIQEFHVYPNPATDKLHLSGLSLADLREVFVLTYYGKKMYNVTVDPKNSFVDVSHLPEGLYFLQLIDKTGKVHTLKFVRSTR